MLSRPEISCEPKDQVSGPPWRPEPALARRQKRSEASRKLVLNPELVPGIGDRAKSVRWALHTIEGGPDARVELIKQISTRWNGRTRDGLLFPNTMELIDNPVTGDTAIVLGRSECWQGIVRLSNFDLAVLRAHE